MPFYFQDLYAEIGFHAINGRYKTVIQIPYAAEEMEAYPVSRLVNSEKNDIPQCILSNRVMRHNHSFLSAGLRDATL